jgi:hypothetical protein
MWSAVVRLLGAARPIAKVVVAAPAKWILDKRLQDVAHIIRARTEGELDAIVMERQPRWRREARVIAIPARISSYFFGGRSTPHVFQELDKLEDALYDFLDNLDSTTPEDKAVAAEMLRVAAISTLQSVRALAEASARRKRLRIGPKLTFAQASDAIQTPLMYGYSALVCLSTRGFDEYIRPEMLELLARRTLKAADTFAGIVGSLEDDDAR